MELGVCVASKIDDVDYVVEADRLGYSHAWLADSQMIWSDCYATLALAAVRTSRIALGTGVAVAGTRPAPVTAHSIASVNRLAPGRTFLGLGTGHTAMKLMGLAPMRLREFEEYVGVCRGLLDGDTVEYRHGTGTTLVSFGMPELGFVDVSAEHRVPIYVSGMGPKAQGVAARCGDGLVTSLTSHRGAVARMMRNLEEARPDRDFGPAFPKCSLTSICVLRAGEDLASERVVRTVGPNAAAGIHYAYDQYQRTGQPPPRHMEPFWERYCTLIEETPIALRHQRIHAGHSTYVLPEEVEFITPDVISATCIVGSATDIVDQLGSFADAGLDQVMVKSGLDLRYETLDDIAREIMPRL